MLRDGSPPDSARAVDSWPGAAGPLTGLNEDEWCDGAGRSPLLLCACRSVLISVNASSTAPPARRSVEIKTINRGQSALLRINRGHQPGSECTFKVDSDPGPHFRSARVSDRGGCANDRHPRPRVAKGRKTGQVCPSVPDPPELRKDRSARLHASDTSRTGLDPFRSAYLPRGLSRSREL